MLWRGNLPNRELWLVVPTTTVMHITGGQLLEGVDLHDPSGTYRAERWNLAHASEVQCGDVTIAVAADAAALRPRLDGGTIFATHFEGQHPDIYIGDSPDILIPIALQSEADLEQERWHLTIRNDQGWTVIAVPLAQLGSAVRHEGDLLRVQIRSQLMKDNCFGTFSVVLRGPLGRDVTFRLAVIPSLRVVGHERVRVPDLRGNVSAVQLLVDLPSHALLHCSDTAVEQRSRGQSILLNVPADRIQIELRLGRGDASVLLTLPLPVVRWTFPDTEACPTGIHHGLSVRPQKWFDQLAKPRLLVDITPHGYTGATLQGDLRVFFSSAAEPQHMHPLQSITRTGLGFNLREAADSIRASREPTALFELRLLHLPGHSTAVEVPVLRLTKVLHVKHLSVEALLDDKGWIVELKWNGGEPLKHRQLLLWSHCRPWDTPLCLHLPDSADSHCDWYVPRDELAPGVYRAELIVADSWSSSEPVRPTTQHAASVDVQLGSRETRGIHIRNLPLTMFGLLEKVLAAPGDAILSLVLPQLLETSTVNDVEAVLWTLLCLLDDEEIVKAFAQGSWKPLATFQRLLTCSPTHLLVAAARCHARLDDPGQQRLEDVLRIIESEYADVLSDAWRRGTLSLDELQRITGESTTEIETEAIIVAQLTDVGIQIHNAAHEEMADAPGSLGVETLTTLYNTVPEVLLTDGVKQYLMQIGQFALLSVTEERTLATRIAQGSVALTELINVQEPLHRRTLQERIERREHAREHLINANLRLVVSIAKKYLYRQMPFEDLIQEGNIGLMRAVEKYDLAKGHRFSTYATWWIRQAITRGIADQERLVRLPVHMVEAINRLRRARGLLAVQLNREPTSQELANTLDVPVEKIRHWEQVSLDIASLDAPISEEKAETLGELVEDKRQIGVSEQADQASLAQTLRQLLYLLPSRERRVLELRYGFDNGQHRTLEEVGQVFGLTRERIRQIEVKALKKLSKPRLLEQLIGYLY